MKIERKEKSPPPTNFSTNGPHSPFNFNSISFSFLLLLAAPTSEKPESIDIFKKVTYPLIPFRPFVKSKKKKNQITIETYFQVNT